MRRLSPMTLVIIAGVLTLLLVAYVLAGGNSASDGPPRDRLTDRQAGVPPPPDAPLPSDPWATLPGSEGQTAETADSALPPGYGDQGQHAVPPPPPPPAPAARPAPEAEATARTAQAPRIAPPARPPAVARAAPAPPRTAEAPGQSAGARPSFNCRNARTRGEIAVCRNGSLASLDRQMAGQFNRAMAGASAAQRQRLVQTRGAFLRRRDACDSAACIAGSYRDRIRQIAQIRGGSARASTASASAQPAPARAATAAPVSAARPSFSCRYARSKSEIAVCNDTGLAGLDRQMAASFGNAMRQGTPAQRELLERTRGQFLAYRDRCASATCIAEAYRDRMREINDIAAGRWRVH